jgi:hypothetical protein
MNLEPINVSWTKARETLKQYTSILKEKRTAEDIAILKSTKAILAHKTIIRLADAIDSAGVDSNGFPKVAICRADDIWVRCRTRGTFCRMVGTKTKNEFVSDYGRSSWDGRINQAQPRGFKFDLTKGRWHEEKDGRAMVPSIPPAHRPSPSVYQNYYILFEAIWENVAPTDPALLAPLGAGLFVVVAQWDLTDIERAVLAHARAT